MFGLVGGWAGMEENKDEVRSCCGNVRSLCSGYSWVMLVISIFELETKHLDDYFVISCIIREILKCQA